MLASSEYDGWDQSQSVPWHTSNANNSSNASSQKSISPVRHRITDQSNPRPNAQTNGRSTSPYYTLGTNVDTQHDGVSFQTQLSPSTMDAYSQRLPEAGPFAGFSSRPALNGESRRDSTATSFSSISSQQLPPLSRSISQGDAHTMRNGISQVNDNGLSRTKTSSSVNNRLPPTTMPQSQTHSPHNSVSAPLRRPAHSTQPSFHSLAYDSLNRAGGDDIDFTPAFSRMNLQNGDLPNHTPSADPALGYDALNPHESAASARQRQPYGTASGFPALAGQTRYRYGQNIYTKNTSAHVNGFMTPNPMDHRKELPKSSYSSASTPPNMPDYGNNSEFSVQGSNISATVLDRRLKGLQPLQQEPANYIPSHQVQPPHYQNRMQYPPNYEMGPFPVRLNPVGNPYAMSPYLPFVQPPPVGPRYSARDNDPMRSALLEEFRTNNKTNKRFELKVSTKRGLMDSH